MRRAGEGSLARFLAAFFSRNFAPPPTASTDTASITSCLARSMNPKRALCAFSKADFILASGRRSRIPGGDAVPASTTSAVSVPA